ncbi:MAG: hypothetical protein WBL39_09260, partial [Terrimicrobiaceae bacterium]
YACQRYVHETGWLKQSKWTAQPVSIFSPAARSAPLQKFPPNACRGERCGVWGRTAPIKPVRSYPHILSKNHIYLFVPAFIFVQIVSSPLRAGMALRVMAFTLCIIAGMFAMSALAARIGGYSAAERRSLQLATMVYNSGNYGIPLMTLAFPGSGPVLQVFVILTQNVSTFTIGLLLAVSTHHSGWRRLLPKQGPFHQPAPGHFGSAAAISAILGGEKP